MVEHTPREPSQWASLDAIVQAVTSCTRCGLSETRTRAVPGEGPLSPTIMFVGEGPGLNEDLQGRPFVGRAGALLDELLAAVPLRRDDVYITNVVKCRPPDNRDPLPVEVQTCWPYLEAQIHVLKPRVIATLGRHSLLRFFPDARISQQHGMPMHWRGRILFPLYHPAAGLRSPQVRAALEEDFKQLPKAVLAALRLGDEGDAAEEAGSSASASEQAPEDGPSDDDQQLALF